MAIFKNTPPIVTNGLVLALDAANPKSYVSGSVIWRNLTNSLISGSLVNGPTFNNQNGGSIEFDGVNDYVTTNPEAKNLIQGQTNITIGITFQLDTIDVLRGLIGTLVYACGSNLGLVVSTGGSLQFYNDYGPAAGGTCYPVALGNYVTTGIWINAVATYNGTTTTLYGIKNGILTKTTGTAKSGSTNIFSRDFEIMRGGSYYSDGRVANAFVYNRTLTEQEVLQNYNATKGRFGL
jgi:hypothetical protein